MITNTQRAPLSFVAQRLVARVRDESQATGTAKIVLATLAASAEDSNEVRIGLIPLSIRAGVSSPTTQRALLRLEALGEIRAVRQLGRLGNSYVVLPVETLPDEA